MEVARQSLQNHVWPRQSLRVITDVLQRLQLHMSKMYYLFRYNLQFQKSFEHPKSHSPFGTAEAFPSRDGLYAVITKLKGCLWAIGHASMNTLGLSFLDSSNIASDIITIAERSRIASVKGTAFLCLAFLQILLMVQKSLKN